MLEYSLIGKRIPRTDSLEKATGQARYFADIAPPRMLYGKILRSPYPHARILHIDTSRAASLPGVRAIVTGKDTAGVKVGVFRETRDQYLLPPDKVRYAGEEVAAVAAIDEEVAQEALELIKVEYEVLPAVFDPVEAMQEGAPQLHDHIERNIGFKTLLHFGDVEEGFRQSDFVREDRFVTSTVGHCPMEPYGALADYDSSGRLHLWVPNQSPFTKRKALSNVLNLPLGNIRVYRCAIGGAFGGRSDAFPAEFCAALLAMKAHRPVKIVYSREETMVATRNKHAMIVELKTGVKRDGTIMSRDIRVIMDGGAYMSSGGIALNVPWVTEEATYRTRHLRYEGYRVYTNKTPSSMMRTHPSQLTFAEEVQLDMIAESLGMDSLEIRLKNLVKSGEVLPSGSRISSCGFEETFRKATEQAGWGERQGRLGANRGLGVGCGNTICGFNLGFRTGSSAFVKFNEDGGATVLSGAVDNGQGNESMLVQIAAEEMGLAMEDVSLICSDTELAPQDPGSYTMTTAYISGNAVKRAAADARRQLLGIAAPRLGVAQESLEIKNRRIYIKDSPAKGMSVQDAVRLAFSLGTPIMGKGEYMPRLEGLSDWSTGKYKGQQGFSYTFGTVVAEVEVNPETGRVKVTRVITATDVGFALNPMAVEGQMEGMAGMMVGEAFYEKHRWEEKSGRLFTSSFLDYRLPAPPDLPPMTSSVVEARDELGPYGAKEGALGGGAALTGAIANAIYDAVGIRIKELPITPESVLKALAEKAGRGSKFK